jgi:hypothetical protein
MDAGVLSSGVKCPGCVARPTPPTSAEVKSDGATLSRPYESSFQKWMGSKYILGIVIYLTANITRLLGLIIVFQKGNDSCIK